jgi:protein O-mannosyl-transferase
MKRLDRPAVAFAALTLVGCLLYAGALDNPMHYDDHHSIGQNPHLRSLSRIPDFFMDPATFSAESRGLMFRPLLLVSYAGNIAFGGDGPASFRWVNLGLHILCSYAVYRLALALGLAGGAWVAAFFFLLHPTHAEPVNYLSSRSDLMVSALYLFSFLFLLAGRRGKGYSFFVGALLTKSVAITLPVMLAWSQWLEGGWSRLRSQHRQWAVLAGLSLGYVAVVYFNRFLPASLAKAPRGLEVQLWTQCKAAVYYLWLAVMPLRLSVEHQFFVSWRWDPTALVAAALVGSLVYVVWRGRRHVAAWGMTWFAVALLPASVVPLNILVSERRAYLAGVGLALVAAWAWRAFFGRYQGWALAVTLVLGLIFAEKCLERNSVWSSEYALWQEAVDQGPQMFRSRMNLGLALQKQGDEEGALRQFRRALTIKPDYAEAWSEVGSILYAQGRLPQAKDAYRRALEADKELHGGYYNLGNIYQAEGDFAGAIELYTQALRRRPDFAQARNNLGQALEAAGQLTAAGQQYRQAVDLDPALAEAWYNKAALHDRQNQPHQAVAAYRRALHLLDDRSDDASARHFAQAAAVALARLQANEGNP